MKGFFIASILSAFLVACVGPNVPIKTAEATGTTPFEKANMIKIVSQNDGLKKVQLGTVSGYSCKNKLWDPDATEDAAILQLKVSAAQKGASFISKPICYSGAVSLITNCWSSYTCNADAYK